MIKEKFKLASFGVEVVQLSWEVLTKVGSDLKSNEEQYKYFIFKILS